MTKMYKVKRVGDDLYHHGILGMKWGKRNGPPYPLSAEAHSDSEKRANWRKSLNKGSKNSDWDLDPKGGAGGGGSYQEFDEEKVNDITDELIAELEREEKRLGSNYQYGLLNRENFNVILNEFIGVDRSNLTKREYEAIEAAVKEYYRPKAEGRYYNGTRPRTHNNTGEGKGVQKREATGTGSRSGYIIVKRKQDD